MYTNKYIYLSTTSLPHQHHELITSTQVTQRSRLPHPSKPPTLNTSRSHPQIPRAPGSPARPLLILLCLPCPRTCAGGQVVVYMAKSRSVRSKGSRGRRPPQIMPVGAHVRSIPYTLLATRRWGSAEHVPRRLAAFIAAREDWSRSGGGGKGLGNWGCSSGLAEGSGVECADAHGRVDARSAR